MPTPKAEYAITTPPIVLDDAYVLLIVPFERTIPPIKLQVLL